VNGAQDSSWFILLHEQFKVFKISYTNCPGNVCPGKVIVRETSVTRFIRPHRSAAYVDAAYY